MGGRTGSTQSGRRMSTFGLSSKLKVVGVPVALGVACMGYLRWRRLQEERRFKAGLHRPWPSWRVRMYQSYPLNALSRTWAWIHSVNLPVMFRRPIIGLYASAFGCKLDEALYPDLKAYANLGEFFRRPLKPNCRQVALNAPLTVPADGLITYIGPVQGANIQEAELHQIKGHTFTVGEFFGGSEPASDGSRKSENASSTSTTPSLPLQLNPEANQLYQCIVYLSPGDYHGFHSPCTWNVTHRRHFKGLLMGVSAFILSNVPKVLCRNERVILSGQWKHGYFSMTAVGATNVGSIQLEMDPDLRTNQKRPRKRGNESCEFEDRSFELTPFQCSKGAKVGEFRFGSSIVLIFEAPRDKIHFEVEPWQTVKYGQSLALIQE